VSEYTASETVRMPRVTDSPAPRPGAVATSTTAPTTAPAPTAASRGRRARLVLTRLDPWSVMKLSFLLSIALGIVTIVAVMVLWNVLDAMGVFETVSSTYSELTSSERSEGTDLMQYLGFSRVMGITAILAAVNVVLITALLTLAAFLYNITATLVGGLHVTLSDEV
jgi:hypothetical protein